MTTDHDQQQAAVEALWLGARGQLTWRECEDALAAAREQEAARWRARIEALKREWEGSGFAGQAYAALRLGELLDGDR